MACAPWLTSSMRPTSRFKYAYLHLHVCTKQVDTQERARPSCLPSQHVVIVYGYIRKIEKRLSRQHMILPSIIIRICFDYYVPTMRFCALQHETQIVEFELTPKRQRKPKRDQQGAEPGQPQDEFKYAQVRSWFERVGVPYFETFIVNGYYSLELIQNIRGKQELERMGVSPPGHQVQLWAEIRKLKEEHTKRMKY